MSVYGFVLGLTGPLLLILSAQAGGYMQRSIVWRIGASSVFVRGSRAIVLFYALYLINRSISHGHISTAALGRNNKNNFKLFKLYLLS